MQPRSVHELEVGFGRATIRAAPIGGDVFKGGSRSYASVGVAFRRIVDVTANRASIPFHCHLILVYSATVLLLFYFTAHNDINQLPRILAQFDLQVSVFVDYQLRRRIENAGALLGVLINDIDLAAG